MIATILTYLCLAYSFDMSYERTEWLLWEYSNTSVWDAHSENFFGFKSDLELRWGTKDKYVFTGGYMYNCSNMESAPPKGFNPVFDDFQVRVGGKYKCIQAGWEYHCVHPIITYFTQMSEIKSKREGNYNKFYINISGSLGGKR